MKANLINAYSKTTNVKIILQIVLIANDIVQVSTYR